MTAEKAGPRETIERLAEEQAALLRLATLVADGVPPHGIFSAVSDELAQLFASSGLVLRFEEDGLGIVSVGVSAGNDIPAGTRWEFEEGMASLEVYRTRRPARVDAFDWSSGSGPAAETAERVGIVSSVSNPILVQSRLWGAITVFSTGERLPDETEDRLERFAQLVATAIANAESREAVSRTRDALERVADEQTALRRVATLVAQGAAPAEIFAAVSAEVDRVFGLDPATSAVAAVGRFDPGPELVVVGISKTVEAVPLGSRWPPDELFAPTHVRRTGRSARIGEDDLASVGGEVAEFLRHHRYLSQVASPIVVDGRLWGAMWVNQGNDLPRDTEERLGQFTELVATAIANAESREARAVLAEEQAALRRVATLVAGDASSTEVFEAVATEVGQLLDTDITVVGRYDGDGAATAIGSWSASGEGVPVGTRSEIGGHNVLTIVAETGKPARVDGYDDASGEAAEIARRYGWRSSIAAPIVVEDRLWGVMLVATQRPEPFPAGAEERLAAFTDLVATAVGNAQAFDELRRFGDEQAALRRVATLVARRVSDEELFAAVADDVAAVLGVTRVTIDRYEADRSSTVVGSYNSFPVGSKWPLDGPSLAATVLETARPARIDDYTDLESTSAAEMRARGIEGAVGAPILVEGRVWGVICVARLEGGPLPEGTERRLVDFTALIATAIGDADARDALAQLATEQAALRRVATLVAERTSSDELFAAVAAEVSAVLDVDRVTIDRYDSDASSTVLASLNASGFPVGSRWPHDGPSVGAKVLATGRPARVDDYTEVESSAAAMQLDNSVTSAVGAPILVEGEVWGVVCVSRTGDRVPAGTEQRLEDFTTLIGTAIGDADSRDALARLADEQAALRRVATLVARATEPVTVFHAVCSETQVLLGADIAAILRFDLDRTVTVMATSGEARQHRVGTHLSFDPGFVVDWVHETQQAARFDADDPVAADMPEVVRLLGLRSAVGSPIVVDGELWGVITLASVDRLLPLGMERRLADFTALAATAIANAENKSELSASRRRIVAASDESRRRIERDLHDGTQQRLVSLGLAVRAAEASLPPERDDLRAQLSGVAAGLVAAVEDLQEISRGIHPAILSKGGLGPALQTLAHRSAIPVDLDITTDVRLAEPIEVAAYFVASEALANAAKHSQASRIDVSLEQRDGSLVLSIGDDGVGGADASRGTGLIGLTDRVEALGGTISIVSPPRGGTTLSVHLPATT